MEQDGADVRQGAACQKRGRARQAAFRAEEQDEGEQVRKGRIRILPAQELAQDRAAAAHVFPRPEKSQGFLRGLQTKGEIDDDTNVPTQVNPVTTTMGK